MRLLIDLSYIGRYSVPLYSGVGKYAIRFIKYLIETNKINNVMLLVKKDGVEDIRKEFPHIPILVLGENASWLPVSLFKIWCVITFPAKVRESKCDVVFCPYSDIYSMMSVSVPKICMVPDLQMQIDKKGGARFIRSLVYRFNIDTADRIITISEYSRQQILDFYPKADVTNFYCSVDITEESSLRIIESPYIMFVGRMCEMKNVITLVKAFAIFSTTFPNHKLVLVGYNHDYYETMLKPIVESNHLEGKIIIVKSCTEAELTNYYKYADLFAFPSLREGFGFPPVEASIMKTPVVSSTCESLKEVSLGCWTTLDNPMDENELARKMTDVLNNPPSEKRLDEISKVMLDHYSIKSVGDNILKFIKTTVSEINNIN